MGRSVGAGVGLAVNVGVGLGRSVGAGVGPGVGHGVGCDVGHGVPAAGVAVGFGVKLGFTGTAGVAGLLSLVLKPIVKSDEPFLPI